MAFYKFFKIVNFKNFKELEVQDFGRINLIVGKNNSGKTALLEALFIHSGAYNPELVVRTYEFRGMNLLSPISIKKSLEFLFYNFDTTRPVELIGKVQTSKGEKHSKIKLEILREDERLKEVSSITFFRQDTPQAPILLGEIQSGLATVFQLSHEEGGEVKKYNLIITANSINLNPPFPAPPFEAIFLPARGSVPLTFEADLFSRLRLENLHEKIISFLKIIEPNLKNIEVLTFGGLPILYGDVGLRTPLPLALLGEGLVKLSKILISIGVAKDGVVLIDEIENGFHYSVMKNVWKAIAKMARECNVQVFASTHSFECIINAHEAFIEEEQYDLKLFRLERIGENIVVIDYDKETLDEAIKANFEVR